MNKARVKYTDDKGEMDGKWVRVKDFLPPPGTPVESITITFNGDVLAFFQREATRRKTTYERILRDLIRLYTRENRSTKKKPLPMLNRRARAK